MKIETNGLGYLKDATGKVISKVDLPEGEHEFDDNVTFVEVADRAELEAVQVADMPLSPEDDLEIKVRKETRRIAIESLKSRGEL